MIHVGGILIISGVKKININKTPSSIFLPYYVAHSMKLNVENKKE
jgi:hypothetical protein